MSKSHNNFFDMKNQVDTLIVASNNQHIIHAPAKATVGKLAKKLKRQFILTD